MNITLDIKPCVGLSNLLFGASVAETEASFGKPEDIEIMDDIDSAKSTVWHYWENGFSIFFDDGNKKDFCCVEVDNKKSTMWGIEIFKLTEKEIISLLKEKSFKQLDSEVHEWGEKRISFDDANIDFYFKKNILQSINYGKPPISSKILILPN